MGGLGGEEMQRSHPREADGYTCPEALRALKLWPAGDFWKLTICVRVCRGCMSLGTGPLMAHDCSLAR